jgi:hypothetical protein
MYSRRDFAKIAFGGLACLAELVAGMTKSIFGGVHIGLQTYSFRDFPAKGVRDAIIKAMTQIGLSECELFQLIRAMKWPIRAYVEYEYQGKESSTAEVNKCFDYAKAAVT